MVAHPHLTDDERFPSIPEERRALLKRLREHAHAPRYNMACGDRLTAAGIESVRSFERDHYWPSWTFEQAPAWVADYAQRMLSDVPLFRRRGGDALNLSSIPTTSRQDIAREPWSLVPDSAPLDDLIVYYTSGASGSPIDVLAHPEFAAKRLPLFRAALRSCGVVLEGGADRVAIAFICSQHSTITYASLSSFLGGAGHVKVNLNPSEWRSPEDRVQFIDTLEAEIFSGDPLSFHDLSALPVKTRPKALISSAMTLLPAMRQELEERFGCPVLDFYSACESGPIAVSTGGDFRVLPHDLFVEIVNEEGKSLPSGERGEITLTGGRNPFLPLLRYRTGDFARIDYRDDGVYLCELEGRAPVVFLAADGHAINNIDVTTALRHLALPQFSVHQRKDRSLLIGLRSLDIADKVAASLQPLFGTIPIEFELLSSTVWKVVNYSSES